MWRLCAYATQGAWAIYRPERWLWRWQIPAIGQFPCSLKMVDLSGFWYVSLLIRSSRRSYQSSQLSCLELLSPHHMWPQYKCRGSKGKGILAIRSQGTHSHPAPQTSLTGFTGKDTKAGWLVLLSEKHQETELEAGLYRVSWEWCLPGWRFSGWGLVEFQVQSLGWAQGFGRFLNSGIGRFSNSGTGEFSKPGSELGLLPHTQSSGSTFPPLGSLVFLYGWFLKWISLCSSALAFWTLEF